MALNGHVQFWVHGKPVDTPIPGVGTPICVGCGLTMDTGFLFKGNGAVCQVCIDVARNDLWSHMGKIISRARNSA